ncbi:GTP-binding protein Era [Natronobacillus azotifigens]
MEEYEFSGEGFDRSFDDAMNQVNQQLDKEILFAMIGDVNAGKSSTINQLIGDEVAKVGAQPGETVIVEKYKYKDKIIFADTPGLDDIHTENSEETLKFYKEADVILFFLNAAGTVFSEGERKHFKTISKVNKEIIFVLNKIDAAEDIPNLVKFVKDNTDNKFKVVPISSKTGENIDKLRYEIMSFLERKGKDILFAKHVKEKSPIANKWILSAATSAGAVGVTPIPGSDIVPITSIQVGLMVKLATLYEKPLSKGKAKELAIAAVTGNIGKSIFRQAVKLIPGAGSIAGAGIAGSLTMALGYSMKYAYEKDIEIDAELIKTLSKNFMKKNKAEV